MIIKECGKELVVPLRTIKDKHYKIYHNTKNRRIKQKQIKLNSTISTEVCMNKLQNAIIEKIGLGKNMKEFSVNIDGRQINDRQQ